MHRVETAESYQLSGVKGSNQSGIRAHNERLLLTILRQGGPMAKADIARSTGLSAQTVSNIMRSLEDDGLIVKGEPQRGRVGQPSIPISLAEDGAFFWGMKIGRRSTELVLINFLGKVIASAHRTYRYPTPEDTVQFARKSVTRIVNTLTSVQREKIAGFGIAMPFQIWRWAREINVAPETMSAWRTFDVAEALEDICGCPVFLENDASAACGAELVFGDATLPRDFLYFYVGYFIGGGVSLGGRLFTGPTGNAGAIGPMPVMDQAGQPTQLLEAASLSCLEREVQAAHGDSESLWASTESWNVPEDVLRDWVNTTANGLSQAIVSALSIIDFEAILIDGWMPVSLRASLVAATRDKLETANMTGLNKPQIREGSIGPDARALGAASLPLSHRFLLDSRASV
ncbi:ROK family transcriptional regulator [Silicimonas sp. MF1-12-2]|uniref:ROK family transcriptional regulator n=1 Tax=Silicimonas sp. MF1-12-2 TaxID=3384793 RepID=UPI0039B3A6F3